MDGTQTMNRPPDPQALEALVGRMLGDLGAVAMLPLVRIGDELGLYAALAEAGPVGPDALAARTGLKARMLREWLSAHAAAGYLDYDAATGRFAMSPEQAMVFAQADSPAFLLGAFEVSTATVLDMPKVARAFRDGRGAGYHERCECLFSGIRRFFDPGYRAHLLQDWLPALDGVTGQLDRGARVADVGCGHGTTTIMMAGAYPRSRFTGFDFHAGSIACARQAAALAGPCGNLDFAVAGADAIPRAEGGYDLIAMFDALHDMGDPAGIAAALRDRLAPGGTLMLVEPRAGDRLEDNLHPTGRLFYAASTMVCTPVALAQQGPEALGAQAGPARLTALLREAGYATARVAGETPFNMVIEARA